MSIEIESSDINEAARSAGTEIRRIVVDREACIGARSCVVMAPGVFQMDDQNLAYIVSADADTDEAVRMAAESCPVLAIHLYDQNGVKIFPKED